MELKSKKKIISILGIFIVLVIAISGIIVYKMNYRQELSYDLVQSGASKSALVRMFGEPDKKEIYIKRGPDDHMWGAIETFWYSIDTGEIEVWFYECDSGTIEIYFLNGSNTVRDKAFSPKGVVY